jgi:hypothetical protein
MQPELAEALRLLCMNEASFHAFCKSVAMWQPGVEQPCSSVRQCHLGRHFQERWLEAALTALSARRSALPQPHDSLSFTLVCSSCK